MKLTIIPVDGSVGENGVFYNNLDLSSCGIPADVHALQWQDTAGWIEYKSVDKLQATDWTTIPDVGDSTKSNPYLSNVQDFVTYRNAVRQYAINPIAGNINWPTLPQEVWTTV